MNGLAWVFRGAVRPPFIEGDASSESRRKVSGFGGQSAPPSLKEHFLKS